MIREIYQKMIRENTEETEGKVNLCLFADESWQITSERYGETVAQGLSISELEAWAESTVPCPYHDSLLFDHEE